MTLLWLFAGVPVVARAVTLWSRRAAERAAPPIGRREAIAGRRVHWIERPGSDPKALPIVFVHGASGNARDPHLAFAKRLPRHRLIFPDRPGHGWTERRGRGDSAPAVQADMIAALLDRLGIARAVVVGHSWGGAVTAAFGVGHPDRAAGLVFLAPATHPWPGGVDRLYRSAVLPVLGGIVCGLVVAPVGRLIIERSTAGVFAPDGVPADYRRRMGADLVLRPAEFRANAEDVVDLLGHVEALSPRYHEIAAPSLVVTGDRDAVVWPSIHSEGLARDIPGARLLRLPGHGHMPHHGAGDRVAAAIEGFVAEIEAGPAGR